LAAYLSKLNPAAASFAKNFGGVIVAADRWWARTWWTVHPLHSDGVFHCSELRFARSSASALRSAWMVGQTLSAMSGLLGVGTDPCTDE